jgi:hypothetical protein
MRQVEPFRPESNALLVMRRLANLNTGEERVMKTHLCFLLAASLASVPVGALAKDKSSPNAPDDEKRICRNIVPTGSMFGRRVCLSKTDWIKFHSATEESAHGALRQRGTGMCDISCGPGGM